MRFLKKLNPFAKEPEFGHCQQGHRVKLNDEMRCPLCGGEIVASEK